MPDCAVRRMNKLASASGMYLIKCKNELVDVLNGQRERLQLGARVLLGFSGQWRGSGATAASARLSKGGLAAVHLLVVVICSVTVIANEFRSARSLTSIFLFFIPLKQNGCSFTQHYKYLSHQPLSKKEKSKLITAPWLKKCVMVAFSNSLLHSLCLLRLFFSSAKQDLNTTATLE